MYVQESQTWKCKKESPESHWSSGSSTAATLTATVSDDIVHDGDELHIADDTGECGGPLVFDDNTDLQGASGLSLPDSGGSR